MAERTVVKEVKNAKLYSDDTILIQNVRLSYPFALKPRKGTIDKNTGKMGTDSYQCVGLGSKKTHGEAAKLVKREIEKLIESRKATVSRAKWFYRDGDGETNEDPNAKGHFIFSVRQTVDRPPSVRGFDGRRLAEDQQKGPPANPPKGFNGTVYGGAWGHILLKPWYQSNENGKRVNANFLALQVIPANGRDASTLGTGTISEDEIDETFENEMADDSDWQDDAKDDEFEGF